METTPEEIALTYVAAWTVEDEAQCQLLLERCWAEDGLYITPTSQASGRAALAQHITEFHQRFAGHRIRITSGVDAHHDRLRYTWAMVGPDDASMLQGTDIGEVGTDGRLSRITEFFGPPPAMPAGWPNALTR